jgi:DNA modification methylase
MREMPDGCVDAVITDPPYGLGRRLYDGGTWATNPIYDAMLEWDKPTSHETISELFRVSKTQIIWGGHLYRLPVSRCWLAWQKPRFPTMADFELAWTSFDKPSKLFTEIRSPDGRHIHPTQKPLSLMKWCVQMIPEHGGAILDPFLGSGTTAVACKELGRRFIGIEVEPKYCAIAERRLAGITDRLFPIETITRKESTNETSPNPGSDSSSGGDQ